MPVLESKLDTRSEVFQQNLSDMQERLNQLQELYDEAAEGGGEEAMARLKSREKMPAISFFCARVLWLDDTSSKYFAQVLLLVSVSCSIWETKDPRLIFVL